MLRDKPAFSPAPAAAAPARALAAALAALGVLGGLAGPGAPPLAHAAPAGIRGRVVDAVTRAPIEGATVYADDAAGSAVTTAADGTFALPADGVRALTVIGVDHEPAVLELDPGAEGAVVVALARRPGAGAGGGEGDEGGGGEVITIRGERPRAAPGAVAIDRAEVTRIPGARGDVLSGIKNLPGVANNGSLTPLSAGLIIRGASPEDSRILVDGFEIPVLYHFLGVQSVLPSEMLEELEYLPGAFGVSYGRASGGVVAVTSRDAAAQHAGFAELSFVNAAGLVQGPIGTRGSYAFAGRRSVIDAVLPAVIPDDGDLSFTAYPRYYDYQAKLTYRPTPRWKLSAFAFGSDDHVELLNDADNAADPVATGRFSNDTSFTRLIASAAYRRGRVGVVTSGSLFTDTNHFSVGGARYLNLDRDGIAGRSELTWDASDRLRVVGGAEADLTRTRFDMVFTRPPREGDPRGPNFTDDALLDTRGSTRFPDLAAWSALTAWPVRELELTAGVRADAFLHNDAGGGRWGGRGFGWWSVGLLLWSSPGLYARPPEHLDEGLQEDLGPERALHTSLGAEQRLAPGLTLQATAFYHRMRDLIVLPADRRDMSSLGGYVNQGEGDARGLELMLKLRTERAFGWIAYTASRAVRRDAPGMPERRFDYDQAHNVIAVGSWKLSPKWQVGGRFQLTTGKPYTPVVGASYQADVDLYLPSYGAPSSRRVAVQHQLDLRVDRTWAFDRWKLAAYLDISNVYLNAAEIDYTYNFDYSSRTAITTLPIIPSLGIRGEL